MRTSLLFSIGLTLVVLCAFTHYAEAICNQPNSCTPPCKYFSPDQTPSKDEVPHCNKLDTGGPCAGMQGHCCNISQWLWKTCKSNGWGADVWVAGEVPEIGSCCYCACQCSCFQRGTGVHGVVNEETGFFPIEDFGPNDRVSVLAESPSKKPYIWEEKNIIYSAGTKAGAINTVVVTTYGTGEDAKALVSTPEQLYLVKDGDEDLILVRADQLNPSTHKLIDHKGNSIVITEVSEGSSDQGVWHVSTTDDDLEPQSHLLNVEGIIASDFFLTTQDVSQFKWDIPIAKKTDYPRINSLAHTKANARKTASTVHVPGVTKFIPTAAAQYEPPKNAKSFIPTWMVHGGLVRQIMMGWEGLAFIIARQVASVEGGAPYYNNATREYSCEFTADHMGFAFLRGVFLNPSGPVQFIGTVTAGLLDQIRAFFESLPSKGKPQPEACAHPPDSVNVECRMALIRAGGNFQNMPDCWDKPTVPPTPTSTKKPKKQQDEL